MNYKVLIAALLLTGCASRQDVLDEAPSLDNIYFGSYEEAAFCTFRDLQNTTSWPALDYQYLPFPTQGYTEIQATASSAYTGTLPSQQFAARPQVEKCSAERPQPIIGSVFSGRKITLLGLVA